VHDSDGIDILCGFQGNRNHDNRIQDKYTLVATVYEKELRNIDFRFHTLKEMLLNSNLFEIELYFWPWCIFLVNLEALSYD
jgi:hypothetical protein